MKEKLRKSLDIAIMFQKLNDVHRNACRQVIEEIPELNDGLSLLMVTAHNGLGKIQVQLYKHIELLTERIAIYGDGDGVEKQILIDFKGDGEDDSFDEGEVEDEDEGYDETEEGDL